jgi:hypothetical protein
VKGGDGKMAQATLVDSNLRLVYETGVNEKGEPIFKGKMYSNLKHEATVEQIFQTAQAISTLCLDPLYTVERSDRSDIMA